MQSFTKAALCTAAAGAMAFTTAAPAEAQRYRDRDNDGISAGEVIAGALIIGGIAAVASAVDKSDEREYPRDARYPDPRRDTDRADDVRGLDRAAATDREDQPA